MRALALVLQGQPQTAPAEVVTCQVSIHTSTYKQVSMCEGVKGKAKATLIAEISMM
jgi:hypothetical protein